MKKLEVGIIWVNDHFNPKKKFLEFYMPIVYGLSKITVLELK